MIHRLRSILLSALPALLLSFTLHGQERPSLPLPAVPDSIRVPQERADFILANFWNSLDFGNDPLAADKSFLEQSFADFLSLFPHASRAGIEKGCAALTARASADPARMADIAELAEIYLLSADSPMFNEHYYELFAENMLASPDVSPELRMRPEFLLEDVRKNAVGSKAADFSYITPDGQETSLYETPVKGKMLLVFYDPECEDCARFMSRNKSVFGDLVEQGELTVLCIYSGDDEELWRSHLDKIPEGWLAGFDRGVIDEKELYNLPSMPTLFTLAPDFTVTGKNLDPESSPLP